MNELKHIAFIMDGNGRWAKKRLLPREAGHAAGTKNFKKIARECFEIGIKTATFYAFSTENWNRPESEVNALMGLLRQFIRDFDKDPIKDVRFCFWGGRERLDADIVAGIERIEQRTAGYENRVNIALNYGGRDEIVRAVNKLIGDGKKSVTEDDISATIYSGECPPPDLIVRTGGEMRLSNFLLWQSSYSELYFTDTLWPDFKKAGLERAVEEFQRRKRRFGGV